MIILRGDANLTLPVGVATMQAQAAGSATPFGEIMAAATLMCCPVIVLLVRVQRYFIAGFNGPIGKTLVEQTEVPAVPVSLTHTSAHRVQTTS